MSIRYIGATNQIRFMGVSPASRKCAALSFYCTLWSHGSDSSLQTPMNMWIPNTLLLPLPAHHQSKDNPKFTGSQSPRSKNIFDFISRETRATLCKLFFLGLVFVQCISASCSEVWTWARRAELCSFFSGLYLQQVGKRARCTA